MKTIAGFSLLISFVFAILLDGYGGIVLKSDLAFLQKSSMGIRGDGFFLNPTGGSVGVLASHAFGKSRRIWDRWWRGYCSWPTDAGCGKVSNWGVATRFVGDEFVTEGWVLSPFSEQRPNHWVVGEGLKQGCGFAGGGESSIGVAGVDPVIGVGVLASVMAVGDSPMAAHGVGPCWA